MVMDNIKGTFGTNVFLSQLNTTDLEKTANSSVSKNNVLDFSADVKAVGDTLTINTSSVIKTVNGVVYTWVNGDKYTKDGNDYFWNSQKKAMETKEQRIDSSLKMVEDYLTSLRSKLPNNSYVNKLYDLITKNKDKIKSDLNVDASTVNVPGFGEVGGFGGFGKITIPKEFFETNSIVALSSTILHEMVHYSDGNNTDSKTEEMDAYSLESDMQKYYRGSPFRTIDEITEIVNKSYGVWPKESEGHTLDDPTMNELRAALSTKQAIQGKLKDDTVLNSFSAGFLNTGATVLGWGIESGGKIGKIFGNEKAGRIIGGVLAIAPAVGAAFIGGAVNGAIKICKNIFKGIKNLFKSKKKS